jgi:hypothetical protein
LREEGGMYVFGDSWARRFLKRWNLTRRVCTTKMRERPSDFDAKVEEYIRIGASIIRKYKIPPALNVALDETN